MDSSKLLIYENQNVRKNKITNVFLNLKSDFFLRKISDCLSGKISLEIVKYNKYLQQRLKLNINNYKEFCQKYSSIELEIKPNNYKENNDYNKFINITDKENEQYIHIFFNDNKEETKKHFLSEDDKVTKINIIIDYQINSFKTLFYKCNQIESICFKKFFRNNITCMRSMFDNCTLLKELNLSNFNTENVTDMGFMFYECTSLKKLDLSSFKTNNVIKMDNMFSTCSSLEELNISNFNTNNVINMSGMFYECSLLKELNLSNFNTDKVRYIDHMFEYCSSLKEINVSTFNLKNVGYFHCMFNECSEDIKMQVKSQIKDIEEKAFLSREELDY